MANVAVGVDWNDGVARDVRLALGCVGSKPFRVTEVEESLQGKTAGEIAAEAAKVAEEAARLCDPLEDLWGSVEYKRQVVKALVMGAGSRPHEPFALVTSASHMSRSMALFRKQGLNPIAAPTEHIVKYHQRRDPRYYLPSSGSMVVINRAIHEYLGRAWAWLRGQA